MTEINDATGKDKITNRATPPGEPGHQAIACLGHDFELHWPAGLLLDHCGPISQRSAADQIANPHLDEVAPPQLAVDREVKQDSISNTFVLIEGKADLPNVAGSQRSFWTDLFASVPRAPFMHGGVKA